MIIEPSYNERSFPGGIRRVEKTSAVTLIVSLRRIRDPKSVRLKDRDYDVTPNIIAHMYPQIRNGSVKECEVEMVGEECEVYCEDGRRRVLVLTGHAGRVAPISPMLKRRISCGLEILN